MSEDSWECLEEEMRQIAKELNQINVRVWDLFWRIDKKRVREEAEKP